MSNTEENLAAVERELAADVAMAEGRADAEDATLPEPAAGDRKSTRLNSSHR